MATFKWAILLVSIPAVFSAIILQQVGEKCDDDEINTCITVNSHCKNEICRCKPKFVETPDRQCLTISKYREECKYDVQCSEGLANTFCNNKTQAKAVCECREKFHFIKDKCYPDKRINENCQAGEKCETENSHCDGTSCKCNPGYKESGNQCILKKLGDDCADGEECLFDHSSCKDKKCACENYYFEQKEQCVAGLNATCIASNDCKTPNAECNLKESKCKCRSDHVDVAANECLPKLGHNQKCIHEKQCSESVAHTTCKGTGPAGKLCACEDKYLFKNGTCLLEKSLGDDCAVKLDVCSTDNSDCIGGQCQCVTGYRKEGNKCSRNEIGSECKNSEDCNTIDHSTCNEGKCACSQFYFPQKGQCVAGLNAECKAEGECQTENSECNKSEKTCKCKSDFVTIADKCLPKLGHNQTCMYNEQCSESVAHTTCKAIGTGEKFCACEDKYLFKNGKCLLKKSLGEDCAAQSDVCTTDNSDCVGGQCQCVTGYHKNGNKCARNEIGSECKKYEDCKLIEHSTCYGGKCACSQFYFPKNGQCVAGLNAECKATKECQTEHSECNLLEKKCKCQSDFVAIGEKCMPKSNHNEPCIQNEQCSATIPHTICNITETGAFCACEDKYYFNEKECRLKKYVGEVCVVGDCHTQNSHCDEKCKCNLGYKPEGKKCVLKELGDDCEKDTECPPENAKCTNKKCACKETFFALDKKCVKGFNAVCDKNEECKSSNSECLQNKCQCQSKFVSTSVSECLPISQHNKECEKDVQCSAGLDNSYCNVKKGEKKGVCHCVDKFHFKKDKCYADKFVNDECKATEECVTSNTHCDVKCKCDLGTSLVEKECVFKLGSECGKAEDCSKIANSKCQDKKCACKDNFFELDGQCAAGINAECKKTEECKRKDSECVKDKCQCKSKFVEAPNNECLPILKHKEKCEYSVQCSAGLAHTFCNSTKRASTAVCECEDTYLFNKDKCYQKKYANEKCTDKDDVCVTEHTNCNNGKCECDAKLPNLVDGVCSSSMITRPLFSVIALVLLALKFMF